MPSTYFIEGFRQGLTSRPMTFLNMYAIGVATGAVLAKRYLTKNYQDALSIEIIRTKHFYSTLNDKPALKKMIKENIEPEFDYNPPTDRHSEGFLEYERQTGRYAPVDQRPSTDGSGYPRVVEDEIDEELGASMGEKREPNEVPYLINEEVYAENEYTHSRAQWTYYDKDDVLVDEMDHEVYNRADSIGDIDLTRFDDHSDDGVTLYIRNEYKELDICIAMDYGSWAEKALASAAERTLEHEYRREARRPRRFRE